MSPASTQRGELDNLMGPSALFTQCLRCPCSQTCWGPGEGWQAVLAVPGPGATAGRDLPLQGCFPRFQPPSCLPPAGVAQPSFRGLVWAGEDLLSGLLHLIGDLVPSGSHSDGSHVSPQVLSWGFLRAFLGRRILCLSSEPESVALVPHSALVSHSSLLPRGPHLGAHASARMFELPMPRNSLQSPVLQDGPSHE